MNGVLLVNKPKGISSNKVVNIVKNVLHAKKCGHLGTLDLEGEGLLPVTINQATKLFDYFLQKDKTYETVFEFGIETDTLDTSGEILKRAQPNFTDDDLQNAVNNMVGKYLQMPPQYSAKKIAGKNAYEYARKGETVELKPKEVEITSFKILEKISDYVYRFEISCSSGTYIRSVCRDLAYHLGTYGSMQCILRTRCGGFYLKNAFSIEDIKNGKYQIIPCQDLFDYDIIKLDKEEFFKISNGQILSKKLPDGEYKVFFENEFLGLGNVISNKLNLKLRLF